MPTVLQWAKSQRFILLLLGVRFFVGITYSLLTPPWEAYDEDGHFAYVHYVAQNRRLLDPQDPAVDAIWEKFQPPLYYVTVASLLTVLNLAEPFERPSLNPYFQLGNAGVNYALHPNPLTNTLLALYIGRGAGVFLSTLGVGFAHALARRLWPTKRHMAWVMTFLYAFWPQALFVSSMLTNDLLAMTLATLSLHAIIVILQEGLQWKRMMWLGLCLAAALFTKINGFALLPIAALAVGVSWHAQPPPPAQRPALVVLLAFPALAILGLSLSPLITGQVFQVGLLSRFWTQLTTLSLAHHLNFIWNGVNYALRTIVASYGWGNLETWPWVYGVWNLGLLLAALGFGLSWFRPRASTSTRAILILFGLHILTFFGLALALAIAQQDQFLLPGRYLLPGLPAGCCLIVEGWRRLLPSSWHSWAWRIVTLGLVSLGWATPLWIIKPAYAPPVPFQGTPEIPLTLKFGPSIELLGYTRPAPIQANQTGQVELCWQTRAPLAENYSVFITMVGADGQGYGRYQTYPGQGNYPTSRWRVNEPFCDTYTFPVFAGIPAPALSELRVALLTTPDANGPRLPVTDEFGNARAPDVPIPIKVIDPQQTVADLPSLAEVQFGDDLRLRSYTIEPGTHLWPEVTVTLVWEALQDIPHDYTMFVHLRDTPTSAYAQADGPPANNRLPTHWWQAGERFIDRRTFHLPDYTPPVMDLYIGVLTPEGQRLPAMDATGQPILNNEVVVERGLQFVFSIPPGLLYLPLVAQPVPQPFPSTPYP